MLIYYFIPNIWCLSINLCCGIYPAITGFILYKQLFAVSFRLFTLFTLFAFFALQHPPRAGEKDIRRRYPKGCIRRRRTSSGRAAPTRPPASPRPRRTDSDPYASSSCARSQNRHNGPVRLCPHKPLHKVKMRSLGPLYLQKSGAPVREPLVFH